MHLNYSHVTLRLLQGVAILAPATYTGFTFAYSHVVMPPMIDHAPAKLLAKQWFQAYQFAPIFVAPAILSGTLSNAWLAWFTMGSASRGSVFHVLAALLTGTIIPYTALYMEPGINGAGKWKVQEILREDGFNLKDFGQGTHRHTASPSSKKWAESVGMKTIAETWVTINTRRYVITAIATVFSVIASSI